MGRIVEIYMQSITLALEGIKPVIDLYSRLRLLIKQFIIDFLRPFLIVRPELGVKILIQNCTEIKVWRVRILLTGSTDNLLPPLQQSHKQRKMIDKAANLLKNLSKIKRPRIPQYRKFKKFINSRQGLQLHIISINLLKVNIAMRAKEEWMKQLLISVQLDKFNRIPKVGRERKQTLKSGRRVSMPMMKCLLLIKNKLKILTSFHKNGPEIR